ncbi:protein SODIUM POTASSIUM ROOT DEFECTIVE 3 [Ricinus communis]|uniref:protein SODIUM POTASSIUM ROOT DEFECTIVE 3 n=1 Tax=Ricinus communis TaxID=3988 RepID=UPI00201A6356|nr:protein SODIUM POTASSIUM ROOT DEFECTIVE 3 [Ricinus communis]
MKRMDLFCSSPASTAICSSLDHRSVVHHGTRPIDHRHNSKPYATCSSSSQLPINPKPSYFERSRRTTSSSVKQRDFHRESSADEYSAANKQQDHLRRRSSADASDVRTHTGSSRHLLSDKVPYIDWLSESDALILDRENQHPKARHATSKTAPARRSCSLAYYAHDDSIAKNGHASAPFPTQISTKSKLSSSNVSPALKSSSSARSRDQVVVLWVSIHCKGCEGKVRKHISKMEGVTSFSIDLATKKVTVIGNVTPLGVLASVSKVKNAQLWPYPSSSSSIPSPSPRWST